MQRGTLIAALVALCSGFLIAAAIGGLGFTRDMAFQLREQNRSTAESLAGLLTDQAADTMQITALLRREFERGSYAHLALSGPEQAIVFNERRDSAEAPGLRLADAWFRLQVAPGRATVEGDPRGPRTLIVEHLPASVLEPHTMRIESAGIALGAGLLVSTGSLTLLAGRRTRRRGGPRTAQHHDGVEAFGTAAPEDGLDPLTGLLPRPLFLVQLERALVRADDEAPCSVALLRVEQLTALNHLYSRGVMDGILAAIGQSLAAWTLNGQGLTCGRLNGSDFAVLAPGTQDSTGLATSLRWRAAQCFKRHGVEQGLTLPASGTRVLRGDCRAELLIRLDHALVRDVGQIGSTASTARATTATDRQAHREGKDWSERLEAALADKAFGFATVPVMDREGVRVHEDGALYLPHGARRYDDAQLLAWSQRLGLRSALDRCAVTLALRHCAGMTGNLSVGVSAAALADGDFATWLQSQLDAAGIDAARLAIEVEEGTAIDHPKGFAALCNSLRDAGVGLGIKQVGQELAHLDMTASLSADYLKIAPARVRDAAATPARRRVLEAVIAMARDLDLPCIAEGVAGARDRDFAFACGVTAVCGVPEATDRYDRFACMQRA